MKQENGKKKQVSGNRHETGPEKESDNKLQLIQKDERHCTYAERAKCCEKEQPKNGK